MARDIACKMENMHSLEEFLGVKRKPDVDDVVRLLCLRSTVFGETWVVSKPYSILGWCLAANMQETLM
jgi:hypothetical protein